MITPAREDASTGAARVIAVMVLESHRLNVPVCDILSEVVKQCLISRDEDQHHVYGIEFIKRCDECLARSASHESESKRG